MKKIIDRLHRIEGQIHGVETALDNEIACSDVVPQLLAIKGAVNATVQAYIEESLESCVDASDKEKMKELVKILLKNS